MQSAGWCGLTLKSSREGKIDNVLLVGVGVLMVFLVCEVGECQL